MVAVSKEGKKTMNISIDVHGFKALQKRQAQQQAESDAFYRRVKLGSICVGIICLGALAGMIF